MDNAPHTQKLVLESLLTRLGQRFDFQSALRLVIGSSEEMCDQSNGRCWLMLIDKIGQNAAALPTISNMSKSTFFKDDIPQACLC